jgi:hypothetical protein
MFMKNTTGLRVRVIAILSTLSLVILFLAGLFPLVQAAVPWTKYTGEVSLKEGAINELFVQNAWVIEDGGTYKMWYTHSRADMNIGELTVNITSILSSEIIEDLIYLNLDELLNDMANIDATALWNFLTATTTVIGYATSDDGINWDIVDDEVLAGTAGEWDNFSTPCVIKNSDNDYEMWFTHTDTTLDETNLADYLDDLDNTNPVVDRRNAIISLANITSTAIGYTTSTNGINWNPPTPDVLTSPGGGIWDSVATPCVIKNSDTDYEMWYTYAQTDINEAYLDNILDPVNIGDFGADDLWDILNNISSTIGYATYDGIIWTDVDNSVLSGTSGIWDSVATPCVIKHSDTDYEMWYTHPTTDLDETSFSDLFVEIQSLKTDILGLWDSFASDDLNTFMTNFDAFFGDPGPFDSVRPYLANTSTRISYATSLDGETWTTHNPNALVGDSGYTWSSVAFPCVVWEDGVYKIWFTQGIDELTAQNLLDVVQGDILPIGYATGFNLVAETSSSPGIYNDGTNDIIAVDVNINRGKDSHTDLDADIPGGVSAYTAIVTGDPLGIEILDVIGVSPFDSPVYDLNDYLSTGSFSISSTASSPIQPNDTTVAKIVARLIGDAGTSYDLTVAFQNIMANDPPEMNVTEENSNTLTFLRGNANTNNEEVDVFDAMFIAQYIAGIRSIDEINNINAASVKHDGVDGDIIDVFDAMFIAQYIAGLRDANFQ